jgi:GNAT superfamily N-acetyltransferase
MTEPVQTARIGVRDAGEHDWSAIWPIVHTVVTPGDTFCYDPGLTEDEARTLWLLDAPGNTVVAVDGDGTVVGTAKMNPNQAGPGAHVASASFMVDPAHRGRGVGRVLCEHALGWARSAGFLGMQFNAVAATNVAALALYRSLGFEVIGTVPDGFRHPTQGLVGLHVMHRAL